MTIKAQDFVQMLTEQGVSYHVGVPDSLLKAYCSHVSDQLAPDRHSIATNEAAAVAMAIGYHLATGEVPLVYLQNSGLGNVVNAAASLAHPHIYGVPVVLLIGWRAEERDGKAVSDEPQHVKQGRITLGQLDLLDIPYWVLDGDCPDVARLVRAAVAAARSHNAPAAIVVRKGSFSGEASVSGASSASCFGLSREGAIECCMDYFGTHTPVVCTTGMASRELYEIRERRGQSHSRDFLTVGGMGLASSIALGIAGAMPNRPVVCLDGDGALLMHMGPLAHCARQDNLIHIVLNNGAHDSVGGQPTLAADMDIAALARAIGYARVFRVQDRCSLAEALNGLTLLEGSVFIEVRCDRGARPDLGRPREHPSIAKVAFQQFLATTHSERADRQSEMAYGEVRS